MAIKEKPRKERKTVSTEVTADWIVKCIKWAYDRQKTDSNRNETSFICDRGLSTRRHSPNYFGKLFCSCNNSNNSMYSMSTSDSKMKEQNCRIIEFAKGAHWLSCPKHFLEFHKREGVGWVRLLWRGERTIIYILIKYSSFSI